MSKKYFAKYMPVEAQGDLGCKWQWDNNIQNTGWEDITPSDMDAIIAHGLKPSPEFRKVKLFLCSRDIKVGDKYSVDGDVFLEAYKVDIKTFEIIQKGFQKGIVSSSEVPFKVIGEISPEATFVKEGDEFDEDDIEHINGRRTAALVLVTIKIKCPCCNKFW